MTRLAFAGARLFDEERFVDDHHLVTENGRRRQRSASGPKALPSMRTARNA